MRLHALCSTLGVFGLQLFRINDYFERAKACGADIEFVEYLESRDALMKLTMAETQVNALYPLLHFVLDDLPAHSRTPPLDTAQLDAALAGSGKGNVLRPVICDVLPPGARAHQTHTHTHTHTRARTHT